MSALLALPAEVREAIYQLAFLPSAKSDDVNLLQAQPPTKALLLACRQLYREAVDIYSTAFRDYWVHSSFVFDHRAVHGVEAARASLLAYETCITHITRLKVITDDTRSFELVHRRGGWRVTINNSGRLEYKARYIRLRRWLTRGDVVPDKLAWDSHLHRESLLAACESCGFVALREQILLLPSLNTNILSEIADAP